MKKRHTCCFSVPSSPSTPPRNVSAKRKHVLRSLGMVGPDKVGGYRLDMDLLCKKNKKKNPKTDLGQSFLGGHVAASDAALGGAKKAFVLSSEMTGVGKRGS